MRLEKADMEALQYLLTCLKRSKMRFDTGHGPIESYTGALSKVMQMPFEDQFVVVGPDDKEYTFKDVER